MKLVTSQEMLSAYCKAAGVWGMLWRASFADDWSTELRYAEVREAAPWMDRLMVVRAVEGDVGFVVGTEAEVLAAFGATVGDEGPTKTNPYNGGARVYALTCGADGELRNENT